MDVNPQRVRTAEFKSAKRGLDPDEVKAFLAEVADALETAQNQSTAMEARARAAVARLQELSDDAGSQASTSRSEDDNGITADHAETISRTLLLAQRTADTAIAQAEAEAQRVVTAATEEAASTLDSTREMAAQLMEEAREEARRAGEAERLALASEVDSLKARRDFLESDVEHLEQFLATQRARLREAAGSMIDLTERVDRGLADVRRPLLSAADDQLDGEPDEIKYADAAELSELVGDDDLFRAADVAAPADEAAADDSSESATDTGSDTATDTATDMATDTAISGGIESRTDAGSTEIGEFPPADRVPLADGAPTGFDEDDITGEHDQPGDGNDVQFSFDDRR